MGYNIIGLLIYYAVKIVANIKVFKTIWILIKQGWQAYGLNRTTIFLKLKLTS